MNENTEKTLRKQFTHPNFPTIREIVDVCRVYAESEGVIWPDWPEDDWLAIAPEHEDITGFQPFDLNLWTDDDSGERFITYYVVYNDETETSFGVSISVADYLGKDAHAKNHR